MDQEQHNRLRKGMNRRPLASAIHLIASTVVLLSASIARADVTEIRDFVIRVDGRTVGSNQMIIVDRNDGTTIVSSRAQVRIKLFFTYTISYQGTEVWQNQHLLRLDGQYRDHRKRIHSFAQANGDQSALAVHFNHQRMEAPIDSWTTSFYKLPPIKYRVQQVSVVDPSCGTIQNGRLHLVGQENLFVAGKQQRCYHFRLTGTNKTTDVWFDVHHRLARQEFVEMGYRTVIELANVRR